MKKLFIYLGLLTILISSAAADIKWMYAEKEQAYYEEIISSTIPQDEDVTIVIYPFLLKGEYCGFSYFSGKIVLSTDSSCSFEYAVLHEWKHNIFWKIPYKDKVKICNILGFKSNTMDCWEAYAG